MEQTSKYFQKTSNALNELEQTIRELKESSYQAQDFVNAKLSSIEALQLTIRHQAQKVDNIIADLNGALK